MFKERTKLSLNFWLYFNHYFDFFFFFENEAVKGLIFVSELGTAWSAAQKIPLIINLTKLTELEDSTRVVYYDQLNIHSIFKNYDKTTSNH